MHSLSVISSAVAVHISNEQQISIVSRIPPELLLDINHANQWEKLSDDGRNGSGREGAIKPSAAGRVKRRGHASSAGTAEMMTMAWARSKMALSTVGRELWPPGLRAVISQVT